MHLFTKIYFIFFENACVPGLYPAPVYIRRQSISGRGLYPAPAGIARQYFLEKTACSIKKIAVFGYFSSFRLPRSGMGN